MSRLLVHLAVVLSTTIATMSYHFYTAPLIRVNIQEIHEMQKNNLTFILYTGRKTCPHCQSFVPKLNEARDISTIYYLDSEDYKTNSELQQFRTAYNIKTVPNLSKFVGNQLVNSLSIDDNIRVEDIIQFIN